MRDTVSEFINGVYGIVISQVTTTRHKYCQILQREHIEK